MSAATGNKHANRSALTRERFIEAAQRLYSERSIDSVSLNEITVAAGQKNRNALQYHFGNRDGLLQSIIDQHAGRVSELRKGYLQRETTSGRHPASIAARALVLPVVDYLEENPSAIHYVKILSQLAALNNAILNPSTTSGLSFQKDEDFDTAIRKAVAHLKPAEAQRRIFLAVSITFHCIADTCRASQGTTSGNNLKNSAALFQQIVLTIEGLLGASPQD
jgi:AcrR family transcriptional regulator